MKKLIQIFICIAMLVTSVMPSTFAMESLVSEEIIVTYPSAAITASAMVYQGSLTDYTYTGEGQRYLAGKGDVLTVRPKILKGGKYKVEVWNVAHEKGTQPTSMKVYCGGVGHDFYVPVQSGEIKFYDVGTYDFTPGSDNYIEIVNGNGFYYFDAFRFTLVEPDGTILESDLDINTTKSESDEYQIVTAPEKEVSIPTPKTGAVEIYVAQGNNGDGSRANPYGTIEEAQNKAREIIASGYPENGIVVYIKGGIYERRNTLVFRKEDSGTAENPVIYKAYDGEVKVIMGVAIDESASVDISKEVKKKLTKEGRDNIIALDLKKMGLDSIPFPGNNTGGLNGLVLPFNMLSGEYEYSVARYPNGSAQDNMGILEEWGVRRNSGPVRLRGSTYSISNPRQLRWADELNPMLSGMYGPEYQRMISQISEIDTNDMSLSLKEDAWIKPLEEAEYYAYNLLSELDVPGEFYVDSENCILYYYPHEGDNNEKYLTLDESSAVRFVDAKNVVLQNIRLVGGGGTAVIFDNSSSNCAFMGGEISGFSNHAAEIKGTNNTLRDCEIYNINGVGIEMQGGDNYSYTKSNNLVENCIIHDIAKKGSGSGIVVAGCGNIARHNYLYNLPDRCIQVGGNGNVVEWNRIERGCTKNSDTGAIYIINYGMGYGTVIDHNFVKDIYSTATGQRRSHAIYPDDYTCGMTITNNVIIDPKGSAICLRGANYTVDNNLIFETAKENSTSSAIMNSPGDVFDEAPDATGYNRYGRGIVAVDYENVPEYALAKEDLNSGLLGTVRNIDFTNNAIFYTHESYKERNNYEFGTFAANNSTYEGTTYITAVPDWDLSTLSDIDYDVIREHIPDFKDLEVEKMGIYKGGLRESGEYVVINREPASFNLIYPANGATNLDNIVKLQWDELVAGKCYDKAIVYIAENPEMTENVVSFEVEEASLELECEFGKTYYWTVVAEEAKTGEKMMNSGGPFSFSTVSKSVVFYDKLFEAKSLYRSTSTGNRAYFFKDGAKQELLNTITEIEKKNITTLEEMEMYEKVLDEAIEKYKSEKNPMDNMANYIYYDFQTDCIGQNPYSLYQRTSAKMSVTVEEDPTDPMNKVAKFNDINAEGYPHSNASASTCPEMMSFKRRSEGTIELQVSVMPSGSSSCFCVALSAGSGKDPWDGGNSADNIASVNFFTDKKIYGDKNKKYPLCDWEAMKWYDIKIVLDCEKNNYDVYVNGEMLAEDIPTYMDVSEKTVGQVRLNCTDGTDTDAIKQQTGIYYVDNIILKAAAEKGENPYLNSLSVNGNQLDEFIIDKYTYTVNMSESDFEVAAISYEADEDAKVSVWQNDNVKYVVVLSGSLESAKVYNIVNKGVNDNE